MERVVQPRPAPVRPRVYSPAGTEPLWLHEAVTPHVRLAVPILIDGLPGSGKSTALAHLAAVLPGPIYIDDATDAEVAAALVHGAVVFTGAHAFREHARHAFTLSPWDDDDVLEYLLARQRARCGDVLKRFRQLPDRDLIGGTPGLMCLVLDRLATSPSTSVREILQREIELTLDAETRRWVGRSRLETRAELSASTLRSTIAATHVSAPPAPGAQPLDPGASAYELLRSGVIQTMLAAANLISDLEFENIERYWFSGFGDDVIAETALNLRNAPKAMAFLQRSVSSPMHGIHAMGASVLAAADLTWIPDPGRKYHLDGARLSGITWRRVVLRGASLAHADLSNAYLVEGDLEDVTAAHADFQRAALRGAAMARFAAEEANFTHADLSYVRAPLARLPRIRAGEANFEGAQLRQTDFTGADLRKARCVRADLGDANLQDALIFETDFTGANLEGATLKSLPLSRACLTGASLVRAGLQHCNLAGVHLAGSNFEGAWLNEADLSEAFLAGANFRNACLRGARLAGADLEGACLFYADLSGASFHRGSSRSGLLFKGPSEGTRTGYYTNEAPEDVRVANLCRTDLRGARIENVDFHLVDLRGAKYSPEQEAHFRKCGAILETRAL